MPVTANAVRVPMPVVMHPVMIVMLMGDVALVMMRPEPMRPEMARSHSVQAPCACMKTSEAAEVTAGAPRRRFGLRSERRDQDCGRDDDCPSKHVSDPAADRRQPGPDRIYLLRVPGAISGKVNEQLNGQE